MDADTTPNTRILVVEDEEIIATVIEGHLREQGFQVTCAEDGQAAWDLLKQSQAPFDAILLDWSMPRMDGLTLLGKLRGWPESAQPPVIMATSYDDKASILQGLKAGAYYYLTKPLQLDLLSTVVQSAISQSREQRHLTQLVEQSDHSLACLSSATFHCRDYAEVSLLAGLLARLCPKPDKVVLGLHELMTNAVEHGNLGIAYAEKSRLLLEDGFFQEIERRQRLPENRGKRVEVRFQRSPGFLHFTVQDQGAGFDWTRYLTFDPERLFDPNGRGIAVAKQMSFDSLEYLGNGNTVRASVALARQSPPQDSAVAGEADAPPAPRQLF